MVVTVSDVVLAVFVVAVVVEGFDFVVVVEAKIESVF